MVLYQKQCKNLGDNSNIMVSIPGLHISNFFIIEKLGMVNDK
jgi:hypothetical protein